MLLQIFVLAALAAFLEELAREAHRIHMELQADEELGSRYTHPDE